MIKFPGFNPGLHFIAREEDPNKRDKNYYLKNVQSFYSDYLNGIDVTVGYNRLSYIDLLRSFAEGRQPDLNIDASTKKETKRAILDQNGNPIESEQDDDLLSINPTHDVWDILSPANKIMNALEGTLSKVEYDISADPLDYGTKREVEDAQFDRWAYKQERDRIQTAAAIAGVSYPDPEFMPDTPEDLDMFIEEFMPAHVKYIEQVIKHSFDISHWEPSTKKLFYRDLFTLGYSCVRNQYDPEDGKIKPVYINPNSADVQKSQWMDCRDSERGWHFYTMSISKLRQYFPDKDEDFFRKAAMNFTGYFGNPARDMFSNFIIQERNGRWGYDPFKCLIGSFEWIDVNKTAEEVSTNKYGRKVVKEIPLNKAEKSNKVIRFSEDRMRFQAEWVVGTEELFNYGPAFDVTYPSLNDCELTYKWIVLPGKSMIEQLVPIFRNFQDLWDKYRKTLRNAQGKYQFVDVDMLSSTAGQGNPNVAAKKAFRRFLATDKMLFRRVNAAGMPNQNAPIAEADGGMGVLFTEIQAAFNMNIQMVEYITGINPVALGQSSDPNAPVTTTQMAMASTSNTLRTLVEGYMRLKQMLAENMARWITVGIRGNDYIRSAYESVIGKVGVAAIISANKDDASYGIKLTPLPDDMQKQWILQNLTAATTPTQGGEREISTSDANVIMNMIASRAPMKTIQSYFERARKKQKASLMAEKKALMKEQSALNQQDAQTSGQMRMAESAQNHDQDMELQGAKNQGLIGNTAIQEGLRHEKEVAVQGVKNEGLARKAPPEPSPA